MDKKTVQTLVGVTFILNFLAAAAVYLFLGLIAAAITIFVLCAITFTTMIILNRMLKVRENGKTK
jgi:hypothetical protein